MSFHRLLLGSISIRSLASAHARRAAGAAGLDLVPLHQGDHAGGFAHEGAAIVDRGQRIMVGGRFGFRGDRAEKPDAVQAWIDSVGKRVAKTQGRDWSMPTELDPPIQVTPLHGGLLLRAMLITLAVFLFGVVPAFVYLVYTRWRQ